MGGGLYFEPLPGWDSHPRVPSEGWGGSWHLFGPVQALLLLGNQHSENLTNTKEKRMQLFSVQKEIHLRTVQEINHP